MALCLASLFITHSSKAQTLDPTQVYTTGNIVQNTPQGGPTPWVGGVYQNNLTCWSGGDPGYCGPNAIVRPGGNINFSYGSTYLYQQQLVSSLLPSATGLQVTGYNFGFTAKNGNGWDDGRTDNLMALVRFWDNTNGRGATNLLYGDVYSLNYKFNWTTFDYSKTFTTPLAVPSIGQVQYGFIGSDNNGWAGPYGPEIYNVSFSLKYKVDPCASNVLSSPTCPGYLEALAKLAPAPIAPTVVTEAPPPPPPMFADSGASIQAGQPTPPPGSQPPPPPGSSASLDNTQPPPPMQQAGPAPAGAPSPIQQQASASQPSATSPQTKIGEVSDSGGGAKSTVSLSSVLNMIGSNQEKTAALEKSVVQAADAQAFSAGETAKATAEKIAGEAQSQSIAIANSQAVTSAQTSSVQSFSSPTQNGAIAIQGNLQSNTVLNTARLEQSLASVSTQSYSSTSQSQQNTQIESKQEISHSTASTNSYTPKASTSTNSETSSVSVGVYIMPKSNFTGLENIESQVTQTTTNIRIQQEVKQEISSSTSQIGLQPPKYEPPKFESSYATPTVVVPQYQPPVAKQEFTVSMVTPSVSYSLVAPTRYAPVQIEMPTTEVIKFGGHKSPVDNAMETKPFLPQMNTGTQQNDSVKKNVQNNEAAGNVTIESIAKQPANYAQYFTIIPDVAFYVPKEIYKNQKNVDNARALRQLSSDKLHQDMVNQQYKQGQ